MNNSITLTDKDIERFLAKVSSPDVATGCLEWLAATYPDGYGEFRLAGSMRPAHRVAWMIANGSIPKGMHILHRCDNRKCVNPAHLFIGTNADNVRDRQSKGRGFHPIGEKHPRVKLTNEKVLKIRALREQGMSYRAIAKRFELGSTTVYQICIRIRWSHI